MNVKKWVEALVPGDEVVVLSTVKTYQWNNPEEMRAQATGVVARRTATQVVLADGQRFTLDGLQVGAGKLRGNTPRTKIEPANYFEERLRNGVYNRVRLYFARADYVADKLTLESTLAIAAILEAEDPALWEGTRK